MTTKWRSDTADLSDQDVEDVVLRVRASSEILDLKQRYTNTVLRIAHKVEKASHHYEIYRLQPVVVAREVNSNVLETLPSVVAGYYVKSYVDKNTLIITGLSTGPPHAGGVGAFNNQARNWNSTGRNRFDIFSDANSEFGEEASGAPDMVITVPEKYSLPGTPRRVVAVVELEVSNRTITQMREDYLKYFDEPALISVIGIKFFPSGTCPVWRAAAVQWSRGNAGITVTAVRDFGVVPMSHSGARYFSQDLAPHLALPGVPPNEWAANRHEPVTAEAMGLDVITEESARAWISSQDDEIDLYTNSTTPTLRFMGVDLTNVLHNLPAGVAIQDLVVDLSNVLFHAVRGTPFHK